MLNKSLQVIGCFFLVALVLASGVRLHADDVSAASEVSDFQIINGFPYLPATEFAKIFKVKTYENPQMQKMILYLPGKRLKLSAHSSYVMVNDQIYHMPQPLLERNDTLFVPVQSFVDVVQPHLGVPMEYTQVPPNLRVNYEPINITGVSIEKKKNGTMIRIPVTRKFRDTEYKAWVGSSGWFYLTIAGGYLKPNILVGVHTDGVIRRIVPIQMDGSVQFSFRLRELIEKYDIYMNSNPREIVISLRTPVDNSVLELNKVRDRWKLDRIVLDAGHGGKDPGAIGPGHLYEKDVVLDITKRVGALIEKHMPDVNVIYTRKTDKFIPLQERTKIANEQNGKLFVSIHANSNNSRNPKGFETYLLRPGKTKDAIDVAERENSVIRFEDSTDIYKKYDNESLILATMAQSAFMKESEDFASLVQHGLSKNVPSVNRGVKQAGFYVLVGASMPNILVEVGFITNPTENHNLKSASYRQKVAEGVFEGIKSFKSKYDQMVVDQASL